MLKLFIYRYLSFPLKAPSIGQIISVSIKLPDRDFSTSKVAEMIAPVFFS